jgi:poly(A) polymerase
VRIGRERGLRRVAVECVVVSRPTSDSLSDDERASIGALVRSEPVLSELARRFTAAGHELAIVGGPVRDALMGRVGQDWDLTTNARPDAIERLIAGWAEAVWDVGREFGTIALRKGDAHIEITTYRSDEYDLTSRKPQVRFGDSLSGDLSRRDFTVNAMAVLISSAASASPGSEEAIEWEFVDLHGGLADIAAGMLRTPVAAAISFGDDPLRMMRAARFVAQLGFKADDEVTAAIVAMAERLDIVSAERIRDELVKLIRTDRPVRGLRLLVDTGLADVMLPELPALKLESDEHHRHKDVYEHSLTVLEQAIALEGIRDVPGAPDTVLRLAALLHDIGKPKTRRFQAGGTVTFHHHDVVGAKLARKRLRELRFSNDDIDDVARLVELHLRFHGYGSGEWTDSAVRRYVRDAGDQLERLHILTRADCTTRNQRKAARLQRTYDGLEQRIAVLADQEELDAMRPDLDGNQIMEILGIGPGREIGEAYRFLLELRLEQGPVGEDAAAEALKAWWSTRR